VPVCSRHEARSDAQVATRFDSVSQPHDEQVAGLAGSPCASRSDEAREQTSVPQAARSHVESVWVWTVWLQFGPDEAREQAWLLRVARLHAGSFRVWTPWIQSWSYLDEVPKRAWFPCVARSHARTLPAWTIWIQS
jgi:hypothetical protein